MGQWGEGKYHLGKTEVQSLWCSGGTDRNKSENMRCLYTQHGEK